ncbi:MAG: hypothetical protein LBB98_02950 [Treponema sp.]|jgi:hypothetical protein|nr:hypothetical protein [Treponema sp.]
MMALRRVRRFAGIAALVLGASLWISCVQPPGPETKNGTGTEEDGNQTGDGTKNETGAESEDEDEKAHEDETETDKEEETEENGEDPPVVTLTGITILSTPEITIYARNQAFDPAGLVVAWVYNDRSTKVMSDSEYTLDEPDMSESGPKRIKVYAGGFEARFGINVLNTDKTLLSVSVSGPSNKVQDLGLPFNQTGLAVTGAFSDGSTENLTPYSVIVGYDRYKRGPQDISVKVNRKTVPIEGIVTRIGAAATVSINAPRWSGIINSAPGAHKNVYIKGEAMTAENCNIKLTVKPGGGVENITLTYANGRILPEEITAGITGYNPLTLGKQAAVFTLDGRRFDLTLYVVDTEPVVWFDYGYTRHDGDPEGEGRYNNASITGGNYYAKPGETLIIAPVRYLVGYNADHSDAGATYTWTVSGGIYTTSRGGEFLHFTPAAAGTYNISVDVTGKSYVTGQNITKTASTKIVCFDNNPPGVPIKLTINNFGPGQYAESGSGYGWSLGSLGGYRVWSVEHRSSYKITGNGSTGWEEAGIVWAQEDRNGNGLPDETWYELRGGDDDNSAYNGQITRRYAIRYFDASSGAVVDEYGQTIREIYWTDSKGRSGYLPGGWPSDWGVTGHWVTYTCTMLRDTGVFDTYGLYSPLMGTGYVDGVGDTFYINTAMDSDGKPVTLTAVRFLKVQTALFRYGTDCGYGDISTEIKSADFTGQLTNPSPK